MQYPFDTYEGNLSSVGVHSYCYAAAMSTEVVDKVHCIADIQLA